MKGAGPSMNGLVSTPEVMAALEHATEGGGVSREEARLLIEQAELSSLLRAAAAVRDGSKRPHG